MGREREVREVVTVVDHMVVVLKPIIKLHAFLETVFT